jgi:hypothetical protein
LGKKDGKDLTAARLRASWLIVEVLNDAIISKLEGSSLSFFKEILRYLSMSSGKALVDRAEGIGAGHIFPKE